MTKRPPRRRDAVIPDSEMGWVRGGEPLNYWSEGTSLSKDQIARAHYENRQKPGEVTMTSVNLRMVEPYPSMVKDVTEEKRKEQTNEPYRDRVHLFRPKFQTEPYKIKNPEKINSDVVVEIEKRLKNAIDRFRTDEWMEKCVFFPLGPEHIAKIREQQKVVFRNKQKWKLLVYNNQALAFLAIESIPTSAQALRDVKLFFGPPTTDQNEVLLSEPGSGYGVKLKCGQDPSFVHDAKSSKFALVFDEKYCEHVEKTEEALAPEIYYGDVFDCEIVSNRLVNDPEKRWIEEKLRRSDIRPRPVRLIEFADSETRQKAMECVDHIDMFYCDTQFSYREPHESVHLYIKYKMKPKDTECISITLKQETEKKFAEEVFRYHNLKVLYFGKDLELNMELKYDVKCLTMVLQDFPRHMFRHEAREWFVKRICAANNIRYTKISLFTDKNKDSWKSYQKAKKRDISACIDYEFFRTGQISGIYRPIDAPWMEDMQGSLGARCFFDLVREERPDRPWKIRQKIKEGPSREEENFTVHFRNVPVGIALIGHVLMDSYTGAVFRVDKEDRHGPEIRPAYRKTFTISRSIRVSLKKTIKKFDNDLRCLFTVLTANEDPMMESDESTYYRLRIHEEWKQGSDAGIIGVMGWTPKTVNFYAQKLEALLQPKIFKECPNLLFGIGEKYALSLREKYKGALVLEVDKYNEEIKLIGDAAEKALSDLHAYSENRSKIGVHVEIPAYFPFLNNRTNWALSADILADLRLALGINYLFFDYRIKMYRFEGSIEQYEKLMRMLDELSTDVFRAETSRRSLDGFPALTCPVCWTEVGPSADYYRLECGHVMCRLCTNLKIQSITTTDIKTMCNYDDCKKCIAPSEIMNIILGGSDRLRDFDPSKLNHLIVQSKTSILNNTRDIIQCTSINCTGLLSKSDGDPLEYKKCTSCSRHYCRQCLYEPHKDTTCEVYERLRQPDHSISAYMTASGPGAVKKCPKCGAFVEKKEGCNHIQCNCGLHFCWICLFSSEGSSGDIYQHMTDEHGGHGGDIVDPEALEEGDLLMQQFLMRQPRNLLEMETEEEESEGDNISEVDDFPNGNLEGRRHQNQNNNNNNNNDNQGFLRFPPGIPLPRALPQAHPVTPPPPPAPRRPEHLHDLPHELEDIVILSAADRDSYLNYLNSAKSLEEREEFHQVVINILLERRRETEMDDAIRIEQDVADREPDPMVDEEQK